MTHIEQSKGSRRQRSGKGTTRKRFPLQTRCGKNLINNQGLVIRRHRKLTFLRHTYDDLKKTALKLTPLQFQLVL